MKIKKIFKCLSVAEITFDSDNASKNNQKSDDNAETAIDLKKHGRFKLEYERDNIVVAIKCFVKKCNRTLLARYIQNFVQFFVFRMKKEKDDIIGISISISVLRRITMGKRHQTFIAETINIDFKNSLLVAKELISAIEHYKRFELFCTGEDIDNATEKLTNAGTIAYRAMEHAYKNYIYYYYKEKYDKEWTCAHQYCTLERLFS